MILSNCAVVLKSRSIRLTVPFYKQNYDFTCGPASLMMAMNYFQRNLKLDSELEMDIWRESNMLESYGASRYGLAFSSAKRGFQVRIFSNIKGAGFVKKIEASIGKVNYSMLRLFLEDRKRRSIKLGARDVFVPRITENLLRQTSESGSIPILLSNAKHFGAEDIPHWIVITGFDAKSFYVNNPLKRQKNGFPLAILDSIIGYKGDQCMIAIAKNKSKIRRIRQRRDIP